MALTKSHNDVSLVAKYWGKLSISTVKN